jgi:hypothetical protein
MLPFALAAIYRARLVRLRIISNKQSFKSGGGGGSVSRPTSMEAGRDE